jgi:hypothetical protein
MSITLDGLSLPDDLIWIDEYDFSPVKQTVTTAVDGSLIVEAAAQAEGQTAGQKAGRPITLAGGDDYAWIERAILEQIRAKQYQPGLVMSLTLRGVTYSVLFVQPDGIAARPVIDYNTPDDSDWYTVTLKFIVV